MTASIPAASLPEGAVGRAGAWTVTNRGGDLRGVVLPPSPAGLSEGMLDSDGCLVCPWHGSRYDLDRGGMVEAPRAFSRTSGGRRATRAGAGVRRRAAAASAAARAGG